MSELVIIETIVQAPLAKVWQCWVEPEHITGWAFATDDWEARNPENDVRVGGQFKTRMQSKDGQEGFDFEGTYSTIEENKRIEFSLSDDRHVAVEFEETAAGVKVTESFEPEKENPVDVQRAGWQAILDNFKKYVEST